MLKHEKKIKTQKKKDLEERLKQRNDQRAQVGAKARGQSSNAAAAAAQNNNDLVGVSPNVRNERAGSKKRAATNALSVEPQPRSSKKKN